MSPLVAGIELGGTTSVAVLARGRTILDRLEIPTGEPAPMLAALTDTRRRADEHADRRRSARDDLPELQQAIVASGPGNDAGPLGAVALGEAALSAPHPNDGVRFR